MPDRDYEKARKIAVDINDRFPADHPCTRGKALCCADHVVMVRGDIELLETAIESGAVSAEVIEKARQNAQKEDNTECPFLAENRDCMLRTDAGNFQPLQCVFYGQGGSPADTIEFQQAKQRYKIGVDSPLPYRLMARPLACTSCIVSLRSGTASVPYSVLDKVRRVQNYINDQVVRKVKPLSSTNDFLSGDRID